MTESRNTDVLVAFGVGLAAGAIGALLLAPYAGAEARRRLGELVHDLGDKTRLGTDKAIEGVKDQVGRLEHAFEEGKRAYQRGSEDSR